MKPCPICHLLNNDENTSCGNCGTPLSSQKGHLSDEGGGGIQWGVYKHFCISALGLLNGVLLIVSLVRGTFLWEMLLTLLLQALGIVYVFFPDGMFKLTIGFLIRDGERANPGDYYYFQAKLCGFALLVCGIAVLTFFTFRNL